MPKVAIITGAASGIGLGTARALSDRDEEWHIHLLDKDAENGETAEKSLKHSTFHHVDVTGYDTLAATFDRIFRSEGRIDFVFANAGITQRFDYYRKIEDKGGPPDAPDMITIDTDLIAVIHTSHLALYYMRLNEEKIDASLLMTASCAGIYPSVTMPLYTAAKFGVVGFMRSAANTYCKDNIRVNCLCPGAVPTNLLGKGRMDDLPDLIRTPVEYIADVALMLIDGGGVTDSKGVKVAAGEVNGLAVEVCRTNFYFRNQPDYCDESLRALMHRPSGERIRKAFEK